ncbi:MAG: ATP-binding protein, partial [Dactylosporangium sp.]|nr:hypothetical protein [Dactylosporangium sp.]NNJ61669.1 ATP-binding protein [Dactylosporangium sp.]
AATLRTRLTRRGLPRDGQKLAAFDDFLAAIPPDRPPAVAHAAVDNRIGAPALAEQVAAIVLAGARQAGA